MQSDKFNMRQAFLYAYACFLSLVLLLSACKKPVEWDAPNVNPQDSSVAVNEPPTIDSSKCAPYVQRILIQRDVYHSDSALLQVPCEYNFEWNKVKYPLLIFLNGVYEGSDYGNLNKLFKVGLPSHFKDSVRFSFDINGKRQNMIVVSPQSQRGFRQPHTVNEIIDFMIAKYRIDLNRIYLTGISAGATSVIRYLTDNAANAKRIAAAVPMSVTNLDSVNKAQLYFISNASLPLYWFCGRRDTKYMPYNDAYVEYLNQQKPGLVKYQYYNGEHGNWKHLYALNNRHYTPNIYQWMLQHSR